MADRGELVIADGTELLRSTTRRRFLAMLGAAGAVVFLPSAFTACAGDDVTDPRTNPDNYRLDLSTDLGILNYAYALKQLEAAFYTAAVTASPGFTTMSADEKEALLDIQKHEVIHRELLRRVVGGAALPDIAFNAATITSMVATRDQLLRNAQGLEDTGVSACNGAAKYLADPKYLLVTAGIVSVEARHAAAIRDIRNPDGRYFAGDDVVNVASGLDVKAEPATVFAAVSDGGVFVSPVQVVAGPTGAPTADAPVTTPT